MKRIIGIIASCAIVPFVLSCSGGKTAEENYVKASEGVLTRTMGKLENVSIQTSPKTAEGLDRYEIEATGGHITLKGSSPSAICYAMDKYLRDACGSMICWSGSKLERRSHIAVSAALLPECLHIRIHSTILELGQMVSGNRLDGPSRSEYAAGKRGSRSHRKTGMAAARSGV